MLNDLLKYLTNYESFDIGSKGTLLNCPSRNFCEEIIPLLLKLTNFHASCYYKGVTVFSNPKKCWYFGQNETQFSNTPASNDDTIILTI